MTKEFFKFLTEKGFKLERIKGSHELNKPSTYVLINNLGQKEIVYRRFSKCYKNYIYWFGIERTFLEKLSQNKGDVIFICESIENIFKIPADFLLEKLKYVNTAIDDNWKFHINEEHEEFKFKVPNGPSIDIEKFRF